MARVPTSIDQFDAPFLSDVLGAEVQAVEAERIAVGEGFLGELARLHLTSDDASVPATAIAKIPTTDTGLKPLGVMLGVYERERRFYDDLASSLQVRVPTALYNESSGEDFALLLEDVGHLERGDHANGATLEQAEAAVDAAAGIHGRWWNRPELAQHDWIPPVDSEINMGLQALYEASWPMVLDKFGHHFDAELVAAAEAFIPTCTDFLTHFGENSPTLVHNDFRLDNMFFDDGELVLLDWQIIGKGDGNGDLAPFLFTNVEMDLRREHEDDLIRRYFDGMASQGAGYLHYEDQLTSIRYGLMFWMVAWGNTCVTAISPNERAERLFDAIMERITSGVRDHKAWETIGEYNWSPERR